MYFHPNRIFETSDLPRAKTTCRRMEQANPREMYYFSHPGLPVVSKTLKSSNQYACSDTPDR